MLQRIVRALLLPSVLLAGCGFGMDNLILSTDTGPRDETHGRTTSTGNSDTDDSDDHTIHDTEEVEDTDDAVAEFDIDGISPQYGTTRGGETVTISGGPFDSSATSVRFNGNAATILSVRSDSITLTTPSGTEGSADVEVESGGTFNTEPDAFYYYEDGLGMTGALGALSWYNIVGDYWAEGVTDFGYGYFFFNVPQDIQFWELYAPAMDSCAEDYSYAGDIYYYNLGVGTTAQLKGGGSTINFAWNDGRGYLEVDGDLTEAQVPKNTAFNLSAFDPQASIPEFTVSNFTELSTQPNVTSPVITGRSLEDTSRSIAVEWSAGSGDAILIVLSYLPYGTTAITHTVSCAARDDGSFSVPSSTWSEWTAGDYVYVDIGRYVDPTGQIPYNDSNSQFVGIEWTEGVVLTR